MTVSDVKLMIYLGVIYDVTPIGEIYMSGAISNKIEIYNNDIT